MGGTTRLFRRFLSLLGPKVITTVIAVLSTPVIVRLLGPANYGDYAVLLSVYSLSIITTSAALTEGPQKSLGNTPTPDPWLKTVPQTYFVAAPR